MIILQLILMSGVSTVFERMIAAANHRSQPTISSMIYDAAIAQDKVALDALVAEAAIDIVDYGLIPQYSPSA
jgi:hypothetical protein